jgi:Protein of unknown function (DUF3276)
MAVSDDFGKFSRDRREGGERRDRNDSNRGGDRGGFNRDRNDRGGYDRGGDRGGFNRDRGGDRGGFNRGGGFNRDRNDRGGYGGRPRFGGDSGGGFDRDAEESVFSKKVRAGKRRTYFFDVRKTRSEDFFITITESTRREDGTGYKRHKIFLYKEDFNRFAASLNEVVNHVKTDLMPEFDYEEFDRRQAEWEAQNANEDDDDLSSTTGTEEQFGDGDADERKDNTRNKDKDEDDMNW